MARSSVFSSSLYQYSTCYLDRINKVINPKTTDTEVHFRNQTKRNPSQQCISASDHITQLDVNNVEITAKLFRGWFKWLLSTFNFVFTSTVHQIFDQMVRRRYGQFSVWKDGNDANIIKFSGYEVLFTINSIIKSSLIILQFHSIQDSRTTPSYGSYLLPPMKCRRSPKLGEARIYFFEVLIATNINRRSH